jgi:hypothetical protein
MTTDEEGGGGRPFITMGSLTLTNQPEVQRIIVDVPFEVAQNFYNTAAERGITPSHFAEVMIRSFTAIKTIYSLTDTIKFGKYAGALVEDLIRADPKYCRWAYGNTDRFDLDDDAYDLLNVIDPITRRRR